MKTYNITITNPSNSFDLVKIVTADIFLVLNGDIVFYKIIGDDDDKEPIFRVQSGYWTMVEEIQNG